MTEASATPHTWEPTMRLRWGKAFILRGVGAKTGTTLQLEQQWRCLETHETEWRPIEVEQ